jgi:hypothetical protein
LKLPFPLGPACSTLNLTVLEDEFHRHVILIGASIRQEG